MDRSKKLVINSYYNHEESCFYSDPEADSKLVHNAKIGCKHALNELHSGVQNETISEQVYFDAKKGFNESIGRDVNFMIPEEFQVAA